MGGFSRRSSALREYLRLLGNPYASLQVEGAPDAETAETAGRVPRRSRVAAISGARPSQVDLFDGASPVVARVEHPHGNPYAALAQIDDTEPVKLSPPEKTHTLSESGFVRGCRRIFAHYIPPLESGRLRPEHRDFIERNRRKRGATRWRLLQALLRYDLSGLHGIEPQFNRERESLTGSKLREIEREAGDDE